MLHSLKIKNFRLLQNFQVDKLGHVNLIVGKNNSGKSTVLEALQIFAGNANSLLLQEIAASHDEKFRIEEDSINANTIFPFEDFFTGRQFPKDDTTKIEIGEINANSSQLLQIQHIFVVEEETTITESLAGSVTKVERRVVSPSEFEKIENEPIRPALLVTKEEKTTIISLDNRNRYNRLMSRDNYSIPCSTIPTQFLSIDELADEWDKIVFRQEEEDIVIKAMQIIEPDFQNITFVNDDEFRSVTGRKISKRLPKVKMSGLSRPVSLNSLGDGMLRVFQLVLKTFPAKGGFLLIDEFENGLHYSVQEKIWTLLFTLSEKLNIQIFATTHSWDCIESFSKVAREQKDIEGVLFRVGKSVRQSNHGQIIATVFNEEQLYSITQSDVEVR
ncbi:AAA family ATPase [Beggiatoa leptomitoformis]|uniref:AAA family ATPase n=1 Tax=Beggiatoa leptomitoformis TaxID=288004 RepID=A0A2N9YF30_9GAMM|nr:ATP-binding protein [Beggiatoa leptomitoformis]ALG68553.1 AAA family ATPase [Beggiatoa leptomitoformis]AUI69101.1 AAA family ATPase [Beggiatoa leptomitoformis]